MKMEVVVLGKNFYDMNGQQGANVVLLGSEEDTNNKMGLSVSEAAVPYDEHQSIKVFPAKYECEGDFVAVKNRSGKLITSLKLSNFVLKSRLKLVDDK